MTEDPTSSEAFSVARSKLEAVVRISALTHSPPETLGPGSKERKSALVNLSLGLDLGVDVTASKPDLGAQIADALDVPWDEDCWSAGQTITLVGLNRLLAGGQLRVALRRRAQAVELFEAIQPVAHEFIPARSKLEAVSRISALTHSPPETLGPGSKERKSALVNLAGGLGLAVDVAASKPGLGAQIADALAVPWGSECWSAGDTITLVGLNRLLGGAEIRLHLRGQIQTGLFYSATDEAEALVSALSAVLPTDMDGRTCVVEMFDAAYSQWAQDEWAAFYFEFCGLPALINTFGGGPRTFANTRFDYGLGHTWDLKVHMAFSGVAPLNACEAIDNALASGTGVGFLVLSGDVEYDDGEFRQWQRDFRSMHGKPARPRAIPAKYTRRSKPSFAPTALEAFFIPDTSALESALRDGSVTVMKQGAQTSGKARRPKYSMDLVKARYYGLVVSQLFL
ncbi:MAG: hypothetical protein JWQ74_2538 [Marmoricola sp.]|nr:hypothetical protein [Marmoricola sp.]